MFVTTEDVTPEQRTELWHGLVSDAFVPMSAVVPSDTPFDGRITEHAIGGAYVSSVSAGRHVVSRSQAQVRQDSTEYLKLSTPLTGTCVVEQGGKEVRLEPGDLTIYETHRPFRLSFETRSEMLVMMFPPQALNLSRDLLSSMMVERFSGAQGVGTLVRPMLTNLVDHFEEIDPCVSQRLADNVLDLVAILFTERLQRPVSRSTSEVLVIRARKFIESHLAVEDLGPEYVAATIHISVSYLHKLFKEDGNTVSRYILERRLERCRKDLVDGAFRHLPIAWSVPNGDSRMPPASAECSRPRTASPRRTTAPSGPSPRPCPDPLAGRRSRARRRSRRRSGRPGGSR